MNYAAWMLMSEEDYGDYVDELFYEDENDALLEDYDSDHDDLYTYHPMEAK